MDECREFAEDLGQELYKRYDVPIYFTGKNARRPENEGLTFIRKGNYEGLREAVLVDPPGARPGPGEAAPHGRRHHRRRGRGTRRLLQRRARHDDLEIAKSSPLRARHHRRVHQHPGHDRPAPDAPAHRQGCVEVSIEISNPSRRRSTGLQSAQGRGRALRRQCHRRADLRHDRGRGLIQTAEWYLQLEGINGPWDYKSQILENHLLELES